MDICKDHQQYLGFSWVFGNGKRQYFSFSVLPFSLSSACFCFTKLMRPLVKRWRSMDHLSFIHLDDGLAVNLTKSAAAASIIQLFSHLQKSDGSLPLVRRIARSKSNEKFNDTKGVSYSTIRDEFRKFLKPFVSDVKAYGLDSRELKHATFLSHGRRPEVNISHARTVESPRFSNLWSLLVRRNLTI